MNALAVALPDVDINSATFSFTGGSVAERLKNGQMVPWQGFIVVEDVDTGDGRRVSTGALSWNDDLLPIPLMAQFENPVGGSGHDGAVLAGKIMTMTRVGNKVWATGYIDPFAPGGIRLALALDRQTMRGISVDLDSVELAEDRRSGVRNITKGRIRGATVCPFQAIVEASIELTNDEGDAMAASAGDSTTARVFSVVDAVESLVASGGSSIPLAPPKEWFALPSNPADRNGPLEITADGRISGIIASEGTCHIAFANKCEPPPKSKTKYAAFRVGSVLTAEGDTVRTGPIVMDTVHPDLRRAASDAMAFYAHTGAAVADVVPYDTEFGIYIAGVMRPSATPEQIRNLRASDISPDWRFINGNPRECCALLAVNNGGFKVPQSLAASAGDYIMPGDTAVAVKGEEILALVASGGYRAHLAAGDEHCESCELAVTSDEEDDTILEKDEDEELELAAEFMTKFGPRKFRTPKVRVFKVHQFHANHDQSTHGNRAGARRMEANDGRRASRPRGSDKESANPNRASRPSQSTRDALERQRADYDAQVKAQADLEASHRKYEAVPLYTPEDGMDGAKARERILSTPAATDPVTSAEREITGPKLEQAKDVPLVQDMDDYAPSLTAREIGGRGADTFGELLDAVGPDLDADKHLKYWLRTGGQVPTA